MNLIGRRDFLKLAGAAALTFPRLGKSEAPGAQALDKPRPNLLLVITDQQFAEVMSCRMGKQYLNTPAMDGLAAGGLLCTRAYSSNPLCMPLRNSLFTGRYPHETGVTSNDHSVDLDPQKFPCMGTYFRNAGYDAAYSGKWHLAFNVRQPQTHGFDIFTQNNLTPPRTFAELLETCKALRAKGITPLLR